MKELLKLKQENEELRKENLFLKISKNRHHKEFGIRWLLRRLEICPNAYYNYRKHRKAGYYAKKQR